MTFDLSGIRFAWSRLLLLFPSLVAEAGRISILGSGINISPLRLTASLNLFAVYYRGRIALLSHSTFSNNPVRSSPDK
jgi:hypothetical protein